MVVQELTLHVFVLDIEEDRTTTEYRILHISYVSYIVLKA